MTPIAVATITIHTCMDDQQAASIEDIRERAGR
jgi:hypothetical protein